MARGDARSYPFPIPPPYLWQIQHRKNAQWSPDHLAVIRHLWFSTTSTTSLTCPTLLRWWIVNYFSYTLIKCSRHICMSRAWLQVTAASAGSQESPAGRHQPTKELGTDLPKTSAANSMIPCMWCGAGMNGSQTLYHTLEERHFCTGLSACASLVGWGGLSWEVLRAVDFWWPGGQQELCHAGETPGL